MIKTFIEKPLHKHLFNFKLLNLELNQTKPLNLRYKCCLHFISVIQQDTQSKGSWVSSTVQ